MGNRKSTPQPFRIVKERLRSANADLTGFLFHRGANFYVFSYEKAGMRRHTFIDTGDSHYRAQILSMLAENDINPANIERIIITHRHADHCGLADLLARESGARILAHPNFKSFVDGETKEEEQRWLGNFDPSQLKKYDIEYLSPSNKDEVRSINGVDFLSLGEPIEIGEGGKLEILACPESTPTHSPDQIIILYSSQSSKHNGKKTGEDSHPADNILFSGDLWLMRGAPGSWSTKNPSHYLRYLFHRMKSLIAGKSMPHRDPREQDSKAKEALKTGFHLIRVKPGHGEEFIGSTIIPHGLLANRDLLLELDYSLDTDKSILGQRDLAPRIANLREQAYNSFVNELLFWRELGYDPDEISQLLVRIYKEQSGGGALVEKDRKERRERLKETLARLRDDEAGSEELRKIAESTLLELKTVL